jgi:ferric-dicitrate binding protein FerR (iron transport regulator)
MFSRSTTSKILIVALAFSAVCAARVLTGSAAATFAFTDALVQEPSGQLTTTGKVKVDGHDVGSGFTISTGTTTTTAKGSSAVVSLGKLGRVEVFPSSSVNLDFDNGSIKVKLEAGRVRVSSGSGVTASVSTRDGEVVADSTQEDTFTVDTECGNTIASTQTGKVELRAGGTVKQIAAGSQDSAGTAKPGKCKGRTP